MVDEAAAAEEEENAEGEAEKVPPMLRLPADLVVRLVSYLQLPDILVLERTCRWWSLAAGLYWKRVTDLDLVTFLKANARVDVDNAFRFDVAAAGLIRRVGRYLRRLDISRFGPLEYGLRLGLEDALLTHCASLQQLHIHHRLLDRRWLIALLASTGASLKSLSISHVIIRNESPLEDELLGTLLSHCRRLETLIVKDNPKISLACHRHFPASLRVIDVQGCNPGHRHLAAVVQRCPDLEALRVTYNEATLTLPIGVLHKLTELTLNGAVAPRLLRIEPALTADIASLSSLRSLTISSNLVTDVLIDQLTTSLLLLEHLSIPGSHPPLDVTDLTACVAKLGRLPALKSVSVEGNWRFGCPLLLSAKKLRRLEQLNVSYAVRERDMADDQWRLVQSPLLNTLKIKGYVPLIRPIAAVAASLRSQLLANCPCLVNVMLV